MRMDIEYREAYVEQWVDVMVSEGVSEDEAYLTAWDYYGSK